MTTNNNQRFLRHVSKKGAEDKPEYEVAHIIYSCRYCDETFRHRRNRIGSKQNELERIATHQLEEHPTEAVRQPYPNEGAFRAWCRENNYRIEETNIPNNPLVVHYTNMKQIELHNNGEIVLKQQGVFVGPNDPPVTNTGDQLKAEDGYISKSAFPIEENSY